MLTPSGWKPVTDRTSAQDARRWKWPATLLTAIFSAIPITAYSQQTAPALASPPEYSFNPGIQLPLNAPSHPIQQIPFTGLREGQTVSIQQVQSTAQAARSVHRLIDSLPSPVDELEVVERRHQYMTTKAHVNRIAIGDPSILDIVQYSQKEFSLMGLARGTTSLTIWFEGETEPLIYTVKTVADPNLDNQRKLDYGRLERKLAQMYPNSKVYLIPMSRKIIVRGQARDQEEAAHILNIVRGEVINQEGALFGPQPYANGGLAAAYNSGFTNNVYGLNGAFGLGAWDMAAGFIINELKVPGEYQIALRVRIAELSRSELDRAGVDLRVAFNDAQTVVRSTLGGVGGALSGTFDNGDIGIFLDYLCANGTAKILTEPQMTVLSGREARFLSGGEFAVPTTVGIGGAAGTTTSFRGFGTSLVATPVVVDRDLIRMQVTAEYSDLNSANSSGGIAGTNARRITTAVEMREGQTLALAGLLSHRMKTEVTRVPVLGDIPKIGPLIFSSKRMSQEENELLILITPEIVRPMDAHEVPPVPGFEVTKPQLEEFWKYNMTEGQPDTGHYHLPPYGSGSHGTNVDYQHFNPGPAGSMYSPVPTNPNRNGSSAVPTPIPTAKNSQRLYPVPQASRTRQAPATGYSNQAMIPQNDSGIRQTSWSQQPSNQTRPVQLPPRRK